MTTALLPNFFAGRWQTGTGAGTPMFDPVLGTELARVSSSGIDLAEGFAFARTEGAKALQAMSYGQRAAMMADMVKLLQRDKIRVRDQFFLDIDPITGQLKNGPEDNVSLGQRREALGLNGVGAFSPSMLRGAGPAMVKIVHRPDDRDPTRKYAEIGRCARLGG